MQKDLSRKHKWILIGLLHLFSVALVLIVFGLTIWFESSLDRQRHQKTQLSASSELNRYRQEVQQILSGQKALLPEGKSISIDQAITRFVKQARKQL